MTTQLYIFELYFQGIMGTSEKFSELQAATEGLPINVMHFDSEIIAPLDELAS